jgi:superkiller protein 3
MLAPVVRQGAKELLARKYLQQAEMLKKQAKWDQSITKYKMALQLNPSMSVKAYNEIGVIQAARGNLEKAVETFLEAIDYHQSIEAKQNIMASVHFNLGVVLQKLDRDQQAEQQFNRAAEQFRIEIEENPDSVVLWTRLGDTLATLGDFNEAVQAFKKALDLDPTNLLFYDNLVRAMENQGQYDDAIAISRKQLQLLKQRGNIQEADKLQKYIEFLEYKKSKQKK